MAGRNVKRDLVFFRLDCDILRDRKIRRLRRRFGSDGLIVYLSLLCEIYRDNGYYIVHDDDLIPDIADMCDIDEKRTAEIFDECIDAGLFDRELYKSKHILSSKGIQARYLDIMAGLRRKGGIDVDLCLISSEEIDKDVEEMDDDAEENSDASEELPTNVQPTEDCRISSDKRR